MNRRKRSLERYQHSVTIQTKRTKVCVQPDDETSHASTSTGASHEDHESHISTDTLSCAKCIKLESEKDCLQQQILKNEEELSHVKSCLDQEELKIMQYREECDELKSRLMQANMEVGTLKGNYKLASTVLEKECRYQSAKSIKLEAKCKELEEDSQLLTFQLGPVSR